MLGPGDEVIHCVLDLMYAKAPDTVMHHAMHTRPTALEYRPMCGQRQERASAWASTSRKRPVLTSKMNPRTGISFEIQG